MTIANLSASQNSECQFGWVMVMVAFIVTGFSFGGLGSVGIFLKPLITDFGWSRGQTAFGYTAISLAAAVSSIMMGYIADQIGTRPLAMLGIVTISGSLFLLSQTESLWEFYTFYLLFGALGFGALVGPLYAMVGCWFGPNKGLAIGIAAAGGAFGQGLWPYVAQVMINQSGWQSAYQTLASIFLIVGIPLVMIIGDQMPGVTGTARYEPNNQRRPARLTPAQVVLWLGSAVAFCCICMSVPLVHLVPLITDRDISPIIATNAFLLLMMCGVFGRIGAGKLCDIFGPLPTYMFMSAGQTVLVFWFPHLTTLNAIYLLSAMFGFVFSGVMASFLICFQSHMPAHWAARAIGFGFFFGMIGMGIGGYLGGVLYDLTGNYVLSYSAASLAGFCNLTILAFYRRIEI